MTSADQAPVETAAERRIDRATVVTGDRVCTRCGYNLIGQGVAREPHYDLLIVRCPECATVASVQEYPLLGRWAHRWGVILAVLWCIFLTAMVPATAGTIFGWSMACVDEGVRDYSSHLRQLERDGTAPPAAASPATVAPIITTPGSRTVIIQNSMWSTGFSQWWSTQDPDALLAAAGGWRRAVDWEALWTWIPATIFAFVFGWFWSIALLHLRRRWLVVPAAVVVIVLALFMSGILGVWLMVEPTSAWDASGKQLGSGLLTLTAGYSLLPLALGLFAGRPLTRLIVRGLLTPRLRGSLALLWTAEGLTPPLGSISHHVGR